MGLFDVFKKKDCEICGKEVGMLGYKKLQDGEICNACAKQLSPWFDNINFELNSGDVAVFGVYTRYEDCVTAADFKLYEEVYPAFVANYRKYKTMCEEIQAMCR